MGILNVRLGEEDEAKLAQLISITQVEKSTLVRKLINDQWVALQAGQTFVERRGGHPDNLLRGAGDAALRSTRKKEVGDHFEAKSRARKKRAK